MTDISKNAQLQQSCITAVSDSTFKQKTEYSIPLLRYI